MYLHSDKLDLAALERIAADVDVRLYNEREEGHDRQGRAKFGLVLRTLYERPRARWRRFARGGRTIPGAVCYHGHYAFMEAVFDADPQAKITTSLLSGLVVYDGRDGFYENAHRVAGVKVRHDATYVETCDCVKPVPANENQASADIMGAFLDRVRVEFDANVAS